MKIMLQKNLFVKEVIFTTKHIFEVTNLVAFVEVRKLLKSTVSTGFWPEKAKKLLKSTGCTEITIPSCHAPKAFCLKMITLASAAGLSLEGY